MTDWVPVAQVIGNIPIPVQAQPAGETVYAAAGPSIPGAAPAVPGPIPPDLHWALVLLIGVITCGLFISAWLVVEAAWIRKIQPASRGLLYVCLALAAFFASGFLNAFARSLNGQPPFEGLLSLAGLVLQVLAVFTMRSDLEDYYSTTENINLRLSGLGSTFLTLFFPAFYFQWHFSRIAKWKKTGVLVPQN
jgi:hypothetical protein